MRTPLLLSLISLAPSARAQPALIERRLTVADVADVVRVASSREGSDLTLVRAGLLRCVVDARGMLVAAADDVLDAPFEPLRLASGTWVFVTSHNEVFASDRFTGPLRPLGAAPRNARRKPPGGRLVFVAPDGTFWTTDGVSALAQALTPPSTRDLAYVDASTGAAIVHGGVMLTRDGGLRWTPVAVPGESSVWSVNVDAGRLFVETSDGARILTPSGELAEAPGDCCGGTRCTVSSAWLWRPPALETALVGRPVHVLEVRTAVDAPMASPPAECSTTLRLEPLRCTRQRPRPPPHGAAVVLQEPHRVIALAHASVVLTPWRAFVRGVGRDVPIDTLAPAASTLDDAMNQPWRWNDLLLRDGGVVLLASSAVHTNATGGEETLGHAVTWYARLTGDGTVQARGLLVEDGPPDSLWVRLSSGDAAPGRLRRGAVTELLAHDSPAGPPRVVASMANDILLAPCASEATSADAVVALGRTTGDAFESVRLASSDRHGGHEAVQYEVEMTTRDACVRTVWLHLEGGASARLDAHHGALISATAPVSRAADLRCAPRAR